MPAFQYHFKSAFTGAYSSGFIHEALLESLQPSTRYFYACGEHGGGWSEKYSFLTPALVGPEEGVVFNVVGDLGQTKMSEEVVGHSLYDESVTASLILGDLRYDTVTITYTGIGTRTHTHSLSSLSLFLSPTHTYTHTLWFTQLLVSISGVF